MSIPKKIQKPWLWAAALVLVAVLLAPLSHLADAQQSYYTVQHGDTLSGIALYNGVSVDALAGANGIANPDLIVTGQSLTIPGGTADAVVEDVAWEPDPVETSTGGGLPSYTIHAGDTLSGIADLFGVSFGDLASLNGIAEPFIIVTGDTLAIPGTTTASDELVPPGYFTYDEIQQMFFDAAAIHGEDPYLMMALAWRESGWQQDVISYVGAMGVMQLMPSTAAWAGPALTGREIDPLYSIWDNIETGVAFYAHLYSLWGSDYYALASYYQGAYSVETDGLFSDTEDYVSNILEMRDLFASGQMP